jgi:hypothetical protein
MASVLSINTKLAIKQRRYDEAVHSLQTGMALSRNLERSPFLVQYLVAMAIESVMLQDMRQFIQQPGAPNLYWPLVNVPPLGNDRVRIVQMEQAGFFLAYPDFRHAERLSAPQSRKILDQLQMYSGWVGGVGGGNILLKMIGDYPKARQYLIERGMSSQEVAALPGNSVVLAYWAEQYQIACDECNKWVGLPIYQSYPAMDRMARIWRQTHDNPLEELLIPAIGKVIRQCGAVDQQQAMLQIVEGLRAYAANHNGSLPASLDDMAADTPAVIDPMSGQPFGYTLNGHTATLTGSLSIYNGHDKQWIYHITLEP